MKENRTERKKASAGSFYTALCICVAMVGFACYFAYTQTANRLGNQLNSVGDNYFAAVTTEPEYNEVVGIQTSIMKNDYPQITEAEYTEIIPHEEYAETTVVYETELPPVEVTKRPAMKNTSYVMPVDGTIICEFSNGELVKSGTTGAWQTHNGTDIAAAVNTEVKSMYSGIVTEVSNDPLWGICVTIDHGNGISARYCGLSKDTSAEAGAEVKSGTVIGTIGDTCEIECESESHLHFEVIKNGSYVNPLDFVNGIL